MRFTSVSLLLFRGLLVIASIIAARYSLLFARASFLFQQDTATSVPAAVRLVPYNSAYVAHLAVWQPDKKLALLQRAVNLNPFAAESWIQLGFTAEMQQHDIPAAERYYLKAAEVDHMFLPKWTLTNFYFRQQDEQRFFRWAKATLAITPFFPYPVFEQMWLFTQDAPKIAAFIPDRSRILVQYALFLADAHQFEATAPIVNRLVAASRGTDAITAGRDLISTIEDRLLSAGYLHPALQIWSSMKDGGWIGLPAPTFASPLTNGDFQSVFLKHGFDWLPVAPSGARFEQLPDQKEIRFSLSGAQPERCSLLQQYVPLDPKDSYRLQWKASGKGIDVPSGLAWHLHAVQSGSAHDASAQNITSGDLLAPSTPTWDFKPPLGSELFLLSLDYSRPLGNPRSKGSLDLRSVSLRELRPQ